MEADTRVLRMFLALVMWVNAFQHVRGALTPDLLRKIAEANRQGPCIGLIVPNAFELNPLLHSPYFTSTDANIDMKSASVALICLQQRVAFIAFRASKFMPLASMKSVTVVVGFIKQWSQLRVRQSL